MATQVIALPPQMAGFKTAGGCNPTRFNGTNFPVYALAFDATTSEAAWFQFPLLNYGSGNITLDVYWYSDTETTHAVVWSTKIGAITPGDATDMETKAFASAQQATGSIPSQNQGLVKTTITISNLDSCAAGDWMVLELDRLPADASDTSTSDALCVMLVLTYSDV